MLASVRVFVATTVVMAAGPWMGPAIAQISEQLDWCNGKNNATSDMTIRGCTAVIDTGKYRGNRLALLFYNRGNAYRDKGDNAGAIANYNRTIELDANHAAAYNNRGLAYANTSQYDRAIEDYNKAIQLQPSAIRHYNRAGAHVDKGDYESAIKDYSEAIRLDLGFAAAYNNRGLAYANKGQNDLAIRDYDDAIRRTPTAIHYYNRALAKLEKGDSAGGEADIAQAKALEPDIAEKYTRFGMK